ncbi:MAG: DMT family transporter [Bacteroidota bacterium]
MKEKSLSGGLIELNLAMLFMSTSGMLGRYIDMPTPVTIGLRALFAGIILLFFIKLKKYNLKIKSEDRGRVVFGGLLLGLHWVTYFYALQLSNVAIGMLSLFTYPAITSILEGLVMKTRILKTHIVLSLIVLVGIYFLVPEFDIQSDNLKAVAFGVFSAFSYSLRNILMKTKVNKYNGSVLMTYQMFVIAIVLLPFFFVLDTSKIVEFIPATIVLALLTTSIGHTLFVSSLKYFSTSTASIISSTQPVYGIVLGMIFLHEFPKSTTIIGGVIIISTVLVENLRLYFSNKKLKKV